MRIQDMFAKDINRDINGVVKVAQEDEASIQQELEEYVVTRELRRRFGDFFNAYEAALDRPTDKIGVWISGFFGSGKSHFLKMLSYLLSNREVAGRPALDYFVDPATGESKFADPMMDAQVRRCVEVPTESILFNIDNKGPSEKDKTAILKVFARVFYEHLGFYGEDLKLARLERYVDEKGATEAFRSAFEAINGSPWLEERDAYVFNSDDVIDALVESGVMSQGEAERWFDAPDAVDFSVDALTNEIRDYANRRAQEEGGRFRLLFCVDEVGQYIGSDVNLMLNLQTIVEELGTKCGGRVWVMVTSQEAIDEVTKVVGNDFSKIQGRFNTRLSLSSSSVDEVIKRRVLEKNQAARDTLSLEYEEQAAVLRNLFTFEESRGDLAGYASSQEFVETYPFVGYQFKVMQSVFTEIRKHGSSGKHLSSGERSMLSGFQEAAQRVEQADERALVPFSLFYDTVHTFLEGAIRRVIDRAQAAADGEKGLKPQDVSVLKLLFLINHIDEIKANVNNIAILMTDRIDVDKIAMREQVKDSLDRLVRENYVSRTGDVYAFLTDEEQDIARAIRETPVDVAQITRKIAEVVFGDVLTDRKLRMGSGDTANDFPIDRYVDETAYESVQGGLVLRVVTALSSVSSDDYQQLTLSSAAGEAICVLKGSAYYDALEEATRIERYANTQNVHALPATVQVIIDNRVKEQRSLEREAAELLKRAIAEADFYVAGGSFSPRASGAKARLNEALGQLVGSVYTKLSYVDHHVHDDAEVLAIARGEQAAIGGLEANARAQEEVARYLDMQRSRNLSVSMKDIHDRYSAKPYGWREADVAGVMAALVASQKAQVRYGGAIASPRERTFPDLLRQRTKIASVQVERRVVVSEAQRSQAQQVLVELFPRESVPLDEDGLCAAAERLLSALREELESLLATEYRRAGAASFSYPGRLTVEQGVTLCKDILSQANDPVALIRAIREGKDDLLDFSEDYEDVRTFFKGGQRTQFERAAGLLASMGAGERAYFAGEQDVERAFRVMEEIVRMDAPYRRLRELPECAETVEGRHKALMDEKRGQILRSLAATFDAIKEDAEKNNVSLPTLGEQRATFQNIAHGAKSLVELDSIGPKVDAVRDRAYQDIERAERERSRPKPSAPGSMTIRHDGAGKHGQTPPSKPRREARSVKLSSLGVRPRTVTCAEDVEKLLDDLRSKLLTQLSGTDSDGIFVS